MEFRNSKVIIATLCLGSWLCALSQQVNAKTIRQCVSDRTFPSVFQAWNPVENKPDESELASMARHDLVFSGTWSMRLNWQVTPGQPYRGLSTVLVNQHGEPSLEEPQQRRSKLKEMNPNLLVLCELRYREGRYAAADASDPFGQRGDYPPDSELWLRDENHQLCPGWGEDADGDGTVQRSEIRFMLVDFRNPALHHLLAQKALALKQTGVFDGIMLDWWNEDHATTGRWPNWDGTHLSPDQERQARIAILRAIRQTVGDDFLILVNANSRTVPLSAPYVNGLFMECWKRHYNQGYEADQIKAMATTLSWAEANLKEPRINCLEGWRLVTDYTGDRAARVRERDTQENRQGMRMVTALGLTHSNGYVLFGDDNAQPSPDHLHNWYGFWDADLGKPLSAGREWEDGTVRREFSNGTVIYNPPENGTVIVRFNELRQSAATSTVAREHSVAAADGDIFLKTR